MSKELLDALNLLEQEKEISKDTLLEAIENSLMKACENHFGRADNVKVTIDPVTCDFEVYAEKEVAEVVEDELLQISLEEARKKDIHYVPGDIVRIEIRSKEFGRIATQNAKNVILQKIREEERKSLYNQFFTKEKEVVTGIVQRYLGKNVSINLGKCDALLNENEQVKGETFRPTERVKVYILEVKNTTKGPRILVSRTHPELVKRLFEAEVTEVKDGTVEIRGIAREAGSRTKMAVWSNDSNVDPVGACVGLNGARVNSIVDELRGEKIDIICWDENPAVLIENALSPAKVICVVADEDEKTAQVIVPDYQLSLAIGKVGQNARLAARLTGYKIDIKSETQARESGLLEELGLDEMTGEYEGYEEYEVYEDGGPEEDFYEEEPESYEEEPETGEGSYEEEPETGEGSYEEEPGTGEEPYKEEPGTGEEPYKEEPGTGEGSYEEELKTGEEPYKEEPETGEEPYKEEPGTGEGSYEEEPETGEKWYGENLEINRNIYKKEDGGSRETEEIAEMEEEYSDGESADREKPYNRENL